ncbi:MAG TPA: DUF3488 and transglutaminase-like domain-containing protein [Thermoanaerobaculia bacterium]|nr:DUF3488 and transglutaminase-like domain-containing protein [Thermoanaerobaculia bacterium]HUM29283.1 DUF3488 and transglutaminase-like domain-containing protein [Thermoanaerobaculia bacterium]HXK67759.1 DUF3488 and transglutaminase-like domain-containing protein [Thermoanaerobaculia bacterium]
MKSILLLSALLPLPLPFSYVIPWWMLVGYESILLWQYLRPHRGKSYLILSSGRVNFLSGLNLVFFFIDALLFSQHLIQVAVHLTLGLLLVKILSIQSRRDYHQFLILSFFLFLSAMASATHVASVPYFLLTLGAFLNLLMDWSQPKLIRKRTIITSTLLASLLLGTPLFFIIPRLKSAYVKGFTRTTEMTTGLSDTITLGSITSFRDDFTPVLRVFPRDGIEPGQSLRLRGITFDFTDGLHWEQRALKLIAIHPPSRRLRTRRPDMEIFVHTEALPHLFLPYYTVETSFPVPVNRYADGTLMVSRGFTSPFSYALNLDSRSPLVQDRSDPEGWKQLPLNHVNYHLLADEILGVEPLDPGVTARSLETYFHREFRYSLQPSIPENVDPTEYFLRNSKEGHCELFASSMVLLLRARTIPARVVGGYLGGEWNAVQQHFIVRQSNSHAWVEAWVGEEWRMYDPTPPEGQPQVQRTVGGLFRGILDTFNYLWDRHVLPFGRSEQIELLFRVRHFLRDLRPFLVPITLSLPALVILYVAGRLWQKGYRFQLLLYRSLRKIAARSSGKAARAMGPQEVADQLSRILPERRETIERFIRAYHQSAFSNDRGKGYRFREAFILLCRLAGARKFSGGHPPS